MSDIFSHPFNPSPVPADPFGGVGIGGEIGKFNPKDFVQEPVDGYTAAATQLSIHANELMEDAGQGKFASAVKDVGLLSNDVGSAIPLVGKDVAKAACSLPKALADLVAGPLGKAADEMLKGFSVTGETN
jgi:hypothetical protein